MSDWWRKGVACPFADKNFCRIINFYLWGCPTQTVKIQKDEATKKETRIKNKVSQQAITFEEQGWNGNNLNTLLSEMKKTSSKKLLYSCIGKNQDIKEAAEKAEAESNNSDINFEMIVFTEENHIGQTKTIFYYIRNSIAHGSFSRISNDGTPVYYFENKYGGKTKARIRLRERTLLHWIELFNSNASELRENRKSKKRTICKV